MSRIPIRPPWSRFPPCFLHTDLGPYSGGVPARCLTSILLCVALPIGGAGHVEGGPLLPQVEEHLPHLVGDVVLIEKTRGARGGALAEAGHDVLQRDVVHQGVGEELA